MKTNIFVYLAILASLFITQNVFSQDNMQHQREFKGDQIKDRLNLSAEQMEQIEALKLQHQKEMINLMSDLQLKKLGMKELKFKGNYTRDEYLNIVNEIISAKNNIAFSQANHQMDIYQLLDENQKKEWNKFTNHFGERREKKMMRIMKDVQME